MFKDKRVKQAEEMLKELKEPEPNKISNLMGGFVTILIGTIVLNEVTKN